MKKNKGLLIAVAAGVVVAGLVAFLATTEQGKKTTGKLKSKGKKIANQVGEIINEGKEKFAGLKEEVLSECKRKEEVG
jgi:gas vesicle protein